MEFKIEGTIQISLVPMKTRTRCLKEKKTSFYKVKPTYKWQKNLKKWLKSALLLAMQHLLNQNEIVAIPTETVYGLAKCLQWERLKDFRIKKTFYNPLIVHIKSIADLDKIATDIPEKAKLLADTFWPGPLTLVLKKTKYNSRFSNCRKDTVAVRVPNHPVTLALLEQLNSGSSKCKSLWLN
jgi:tRNA threonylcarbamoyl adenosine modification protein (Sua5/YciO/YrdC/YwlC family)